MSTYDEIKARDDECNNLAESDWFNRGAAAHQDRHELLKMVEAAESKLHSLGELADMYRQDGLTAYAQDIEAILIGVSQIPINRTDAYINLSTATTHYI